METERGTLSESARGLTERLRQDSRQQIDTRKRTAAESIDQIAQALSRAGEQLDQSQPRLASYANQIAGNISTVASRIRDGSVEDLIDDTRQLARRNPGLFILGGFVVGVALARFMKASQQSAMMSEAGDYTTSDMSTSNIGASGEDFGSDFASASADQSAYPSQDYSPSTPVSDQTASGKTSSGYTPGAGG